MKKLLIVIILLVGSTFCAKSQVTDIYSQNLLDIGVVNNINSKNGNISLDDINGTIYLADNFSKGKIIDEEKNLKIDVYLRYDIYRDQIEIIEKLDQKDIKILERLKRYSYQYKNSELKLFENFTSEKFENGKYLSVLAKTETAMLLKNYYQIFIPSKEATSSYESKKPARLITEFKYYISRDQGNSFEEINAHKRRILKTFNEDNQDKIKAFIKKNNFNFRGSDAEIENELKRVIFYSTTLD